MLCLNFLNIFNLVFKFVLIFQPGDQLRSFNSLCSKRGRACLGFFLSAYLFNIENHSTESLSKEVIVNTKTKENGRNKNILHDNIQKIKKAM